MSLSLSVFWDALGVPSTKVPIDVTTFVWYVLPPALCYLIVAALAVSPGTHALRVALWPVIALLALRATASVDMSHGIPERAFLNVDLTLAMFSVASRTLDWTLSKGPLVRHYRPGNSAPSKIMDILELAPNLRGIGWNWSSELYIPRETRPRNRMGFVFSTLLSAIAHALICGALHRAVLTLAPVGTGPITDGSSIFDETLAFTVQYFRACMISVFAALAIYCVLQAGYDACTLPAVLFLGQDPVQWPPAFEAPWFATSLTEFWGRRWHQWFRRTFLIMGGYPLSFVLGRPGKVLGSFLASAIFHHIAIAALYSKGETRRMVTGFGMMAVGVLVERVFYRSTGKKVGGVVGWIWTMSWLVVWGNFIIEGFARGGMFGCSSFLDSMSPARAPVEHLVTAFDHWLHTL